MGMEMSRITRAAVCLAGLLALSACAPDGLADFKSGQAAMQKLNHLTMSWKTAYGVFRDTVELDCDAQYYHRKSTKDLTDKAIEEGADILTFLAQWTGLNVP